MIGADRCTYHAVAFVFASMFINQVIPTGVDFDR